MTNDMALSIGDCISRYQSWSADFNHATRASARRSRFIGKGFYPLHMFSAMGLGAGLQGKTLAGS